MHFMKKPHTVFDVVTHELCLGCGMCEVVCPVAAIEIQFSDSHGYHVPVVDSDKCIKCGLCVKVCSGWQVDHCALNLQKFGKLPENPYLGNYSELLIANSKDEDIRSKGASGGFVSQLLINLLNEKKIDAALIVKAGIDQSYSPRIILAKSKEEILNGQGSCYLNAPLCKELKQVLDKNLKIALVGLPCHINSIQKSYAYLPELKEKIVFTIGLFCNGVYKSSAIEQFCQANKISTEEIKKLEFRRGAWPGRMKFTMQNGDPLYLKRNHIFHVNYIKRCYYCYDYLADTADISVGDNWLATDNKGSNAVVVRNLKIIQFFHNIDFTALDSRDFFESHRLFHSRRRYTVSLWNLGRIHGKAVPVIKPAIKLPIYLWNLVVAWLDWKRSEYKSKNFSKIRKFMKVRGTILDNFVYPRPVPKEFLPEDNNALKDNNSLSVLITEGDVVGNKGAVAMVNCLIRDISEVFPDAGFIVSSKHIKKDVTYRKNLKTLYDNGPHFDLALLQAGLWAILNSIGINLRTLLQNKICQAYLKADIVISATGISFIEDFGKKKIYHFSKYLLLPLLFNKKIVKFTQSLGPIESRYNRFMASSLLPRICQVMARGEISRKYMQEIGVSKNVHSYPDIAITLESENSSRIEVLTKKRGDRKVIGISPNIVCKNLTQGNIYIKELKKICNYVIENLKSYDVVFIPHTITEAGKGKNDDMSICRELAQDLPPSRVSLIDTVDYSPGELKQLISETEFFIGSRYHSLVAAVSSSVPCLGIGWHYKYNELMAWYKLEDNILNIWELGNKDVLEVFERSFEAREEMRNCLQAINPEIKQLAKNASIQIIRELKR